MTKEESYYPFIDGLRALAVIAVIIHHIVPFFRIPVHGLGKQWVDLGRFGVDLFFVISGFLITGLLIKNFTDPINIRRFYLRRWFKIFPQYLFVLSFGFVLMLFPTLTVIYPSQPMYLADQIHHLLLIQNYFTQAPTLAHTWSLCIEEHFYLFYPLIIAGIFAAIKDAQRRRAVLIVTVLALGVLTALYRHYNLKPPAPDAGLFDPINFQMTHFRIDALMFGCLLKLCEPWYSSQKNNTLFAVTALAVSLFLYHVCFYHDRDSRAPELFLFAYLAAGALFLAAYTQIKLFSNVLERPSLRFIGKNSYGLYLWHYPLLFVCAPLLRIWGTPLTICTYLALLLVCGVGSTATIENHFLKVREKWS